jgi:hypothetical protein
VLVIITHKETSSSSASASVAAATAAIALKFHPKHVTNKNKAKHWYCDLYILMNYLFNPYMSKKLIFVIFSEIF